MTVKKRWEWVYASVLLLILTFISSIAIGPTWMVWLSLAGILISSIGAGISHLKPHKYASRSVSLILACIFGGFFLAGFILDSMFLKPLSDDLLKVPPLNTPISDSRQLFTFKAPFGWKAEFKTTLQGEGVILRPADKASYMGISELHVFFRTPDTPIKNPAKVLELLSSQLEKTSPPKGSTSLFQLTTEPATLLDGSAGLWSTFSSRKLWVPIRQVTLFGIKENKYICSVSALGLEKHSTLYRVLCLGVFHTIKKTPTSSTKIRLQ